jgi:soluble lytic murein transglycosylase-like protein
MKRFLYPTAAFLGGLLLMNVPAFAQVPATDPPIGAAFDRLLDRAGTAADAATLVAEADEWRRRAAQSVATGNPTEARESLRRAGEIIAALPEADPRREDPFLRSYLREIADQLRGLETAPPVSVDIATEHPRVAAFVAYYRTAGRPALRAGLGRMEVYREAVREIFRQEGVPEGLIAVGLVESGFRPEALSPKSALGIWQFMPATGARYGLRQTAFGDDRRDPLKSTRAAARYLRDLYELFGDWTLAVAAYNTGENRIAGIIRRTGIRDFWTMADRGWLPAETVAYVPAVLAASHFINPPAESGPSAPPSAIPLKR